MIRTMDAREIATANEILRGVVGSTTHGTAIDGQDDRDEMGVFVEPPEDVCGLAPCEHYIHRDKPATSIFTFILTLERLLLRSHPD